MTGPTPRLTLTPALVVQLDARTEENRGTLKIGRDDGTITAFLDWSRETGTLSLAVGGGTAPDQLVQVFDLADLRPLKAWFADRGIHPEPSVDDLGALATAFAELVDDDEDNRATDAEIAAALDQLRSAATRAGGGELLPVLSNADAVICRLQRSLRAAEARLAAP
jgi:hypothetical protein